MNNNVSFRCIKCMSRFLRVDMNIKFWYAVLVCSVCDVTAMMARPAVSVSRAAGCVCRAGAGAGLDRGQTASVSGETGPVPSVTLSRYAETPVM